MNPRICICCGKPIADLGIALSRNPNICGACSRMADAIDEPSLEKPSLDELDRSSATSTARAEGIAGGKAADETIEPTKRT